MSLWRSICEEFVRNLPSPYVIKDRAGASPYLSRWYLYNGPTMPDGTHPFTEEGDPREGMIDIDRPFAVFLHKFHRGDDEPELHNHPWQWAFAIVLAGGYDEERATEYSLHPEYELDEDKKLFTLIEKRFVAPGTVNLIFSETYHRVDLREKDAWSLFIAGPRTGVSWGFWNRLTNLFMPWEQFVAKKRKKAA